jgi:hypothetical protein
VQDPGLTRESDMYEPILDTLLNTNSIPEAVQANPSQTYSVIPTDIDWSVPPHAGGPVATSKSWDSSTLSY